MARKEYRKNTKKAPISTKKLTGRRVKNADGTTTLYLDEGHSVKNPRPEDYTGHQVMSYWHYQYLKDEKLHYITELDSKDGVLSETFVDTMDEVYEFLKKNNITLPDCAKVNLEIERLRKNYVVTSEDLSYRGEINTHGDVDEY